MQLEGDRDDSGVLVWSFWDVAVKLEESASANLTVTSVILSPIQLESIVPHHHMYNIFQNVAFLVNGWIFNFLVEILLIPT